MTRMRAKTKNNLELKNRQKISLNLKLVVIVATVMSGLMASFFVIYFKR